MSHSNPLTQDSLDFWAEQDKKDYIGKHDRRRFWACRIGFHEWRWLGSDYTCQCYFCGKIASIGDSQ
jgi:hypothetical protein